MDAYAVGASLGCGAPALMRHGQLTFPYCFKACKILDNGPLRFTAELVYVTTADGITEHRLVTLDKGSHFNRLTVWYDGIMATLFPNGVDESVVLKGAQPHGVGIVRPYRGQPYTYYFGSAWSLYDVQTFAHWKLLADEYLLRLKHPLQIQ